MKPVVHNLQYMMVYNFNKDTVNFEEVGIIKPKKKPKA